MFRRILLSVILLKKNLFVITIWGRNVVAQKKLLLRKAHKKEAAGRRGVVPDNKRWDCNGRRDPGTENRLLRNGWPLWSGISPLILLSRKKRKKETPPHILSSSIVGQKSASYPQRGLWTGYRDSGRVSPGSNRASRERSLDNIGGGGEQHSTSHPKKEKFFHLPPASIQSSEVINWPLPLLHLIHQGERERGKMYCATIYGPNWVCALGFCLDRGFPSVPRQCSLLSTLWW